MLKSTLINVLKLGLAGGLILWLLQSGQLDLQQLFRIITNPLMAIAMVSYWLIGPSLLGSFRWLLLLRGAGYQLSWLRALRLQLIGFFFNSAMPGAVGGDLVKVVYVFRENRTMGKTPAMMSILLDRIIGLGGLFTIALLATLFSLEQVLGSPTLRGMFFLLVGLNAATAIFFLAALWHYRGQDPFLQLLQKGVPGFHLFAKIYEAVRIYRYQRQYILYCYGLSLVIQLGALLLFYYIAHDILTPEQVVPFSSIASIFPLGFLTTALPIAPGGLGVGHVAFDRLFYMVGLNHGANVFNLFIISQLALNMLGAIPYLRIKQKEQIKKLDIGKSSPEHIS